MARKQTEYFGEKAKRTPRAVAGKKKETKRKYTRRKVASVPMVSIWVPADQAFNLGLQLGSQSRG